MPVKSLVDLCLNTILKNINLVSGIGDELPHDNPHVEKILARVPTAAQLREMEVNSPQLQGHTTKYWKALIHHKFPTARKKNYVPSDPAGWWKVYRRYEKENEESLKQATAAMKDAFAGLAKESSGNVATIVEGSRLPRPPRTGRRIGAPRVGQRKAGSSTLTFTAGSRTKLVSGKSVLRRARREAKDIAAQRGSLSLISRVHTGSQLRSAPSGLIEHHRVASQPEFRKGLASTSSRPAESPNDARSSSKRKREEPEAIVINVSEDEPDDLFGEDSDDDRPPAKTAKLNSSKRTASSRNAPLFDDDEIESYSSARKTPVTISTHNSRPSDTSRVSSQLRRSSSGLLPGKPGSTRFMKGSTNSKASSSPLKSSPAPPAAGAKSSSSSNMTRVASRPRHDSPPPPPAATSHQSLDFGFPRKRKTDIFMKPKRRPA
ncbi:hypothetical protein jhhlp_007202 [Lomentospora prolificans]|uniref:Elongin-A n=1 Tax=Lomentospora prolificans TaxID=41688 RepID=A0A2N3N200_9PEZI|nr:hypothetical protein jhhlp_007202 [Lomentospora prolificans]